jgi:hypothetical protein
VFSVGKSFILMKETTVFSIKLVSVYQTTPCHKPEDHTTYDCFYSIPLLRPHIQLSVSVISRTVIADKDFIFKSISEGGP